MTGFRFAPRLIVLSLAACTLQARATSPPQVPVILSPAIVVAGSPELLSVQANHASSVDGEWLGRKIQFIRARSGSAWFALAGVDVEAPVGPSTLHIIAHQDGKDVDMSRTIDIHPAHYRTGSLTVAPKFVEPSPEALKQIEAESQLKAKVYAASTSEPLWRGSFRAPVPSQPTDSFGTRRMFNGKLASIHKGADFRAAAGTPVHASNSGIVVLARPLYFSRIDVHEGQRVAAGDRIGLSGATGRVTGPHLHWAVRWQGANLDPVKLLHINLNTIP
jgi:murein DD-endopeptidase MepM/ murein hydrolase activator NlpD